MGSVHFMRAIAIVNIGELAVKRYGIDINQLGIPESVFLNPMNLIPIGEVNNWFSLLVQQTANPDIILELAQVLDIESMGSIGRWLFSGYDLASTIRRINYGVGSLQSGAFMAGAQVGSIIKWTYNNSSFSPQVKVHDSVRAAVFMTKVLREYLGADFAPQRIMISGVCKNEQAYKEFFGCDIGWSHSKTEVWIHSDLRLATKQSRQISNKRLAMNFAELDEILNMPEPEDELKVIYEMVNYSRYFGLPTLSSVSSLLGLSEQQFQRRLHSLGLNFSTVCGYVMSNVAVDLLSKGIEVDQIAVRLGYTNVASFNRMFKKHRGLTPKQYIRHFHDVF
ncbi:helix-turn-helix domain-containing protein [Vibrio tapetis subsp. quintayensis]|uniref:AraC family transcriptional regulator n=1 Tax=Vibrio tapetis TaxID=52443 RepID=UPI0025B2B996|nr:AraC family transcriptional regulator [Vibrio tapetis]MDN3681348.1 helix-turn-helix domain-containing protein [Vibrio tapetis subsp. quintayensis]